MISKNFFNIFNYGSLALVAVLVVMMYAKLIPSETFIFILAFTIILLVARIVLRVFYIKQTRKNNAGG